MCRDQMMHMERLIGDGSSRCRDIHVGRRMELRSESGLGARKRVKIVWRCESRTTAHEWGTEGG